MVGLLAVHEFGRGQEQHVAVRRVWPWFSALAVAGDKVGAIGLVIARSAGSAAAAPVRRLVSPRQFEKTGMARADLPGDLEARFHLARARPGGFVMA